MERDEAREAEARIVGGLASLRAQLTWLENEIAKAEDLGVDVSELKGEAEFLRDLVGGERD